MGRPDLVELDKGYVLTCQSHTTSKKVMVDFDV